LLPTMQPAKCPSPPRCFQFFSCSVFFLHLSSLLFTPDRRTWTPSSPLQIITLRATVSSECLFRFSFFRLNTQRSLFSRNHRPISLSLSFCTRNNFSFLYQLLRTLRLPATRHNPPPLFSRSLYPFFLGFASLIWCLLPLVYIMCSDIPSTPKGKSCLKMALFDLLFLSVQPPPVGSFGLYTPLHPWARPSSFPRPQIVSIREPLPFIFH